MPNYFLEVVKNQRELRQFIHLPYTLYQQEKHWVPPIRSEERKTYSARHNPMFQYCDVTHFLLRNGEAIVGRISAFVHHRAVAHWKDKVGLFGAFECIDCAEASSMLLNSAADWLKSRGMRVMRGPWSFASQEFGLLVEGFDHPPMVMAPYHFDYYGGQMESAGLGKVKDLLVYELNADDFKLSDRVAQFADRVKKRHQVTLRPLNMRRLKDDVRVLMEMGNQSTHDNWGYVPVSEDEAEDLAKGLKPIVDPDLILIAEIEGRPVGYMLVLPDINLLLRGGSGRLTPRQLWKLGFQRRSIHEYRIWGLGVIPEYHRRGLDTLFYKHLHDQLVAKGAQRIEANYILEDNMAMNNPVIKMGFKVCKRYRVYEKTI